MESKANMENIGNVENIENRRNMENIGNTQNMENSLAIMQNAIGMVEKRNPSSGQLSSLGHSDRKVVWCRANSFELN